MSTYTHTGRRDHVGYVHCGAKLWGHHMPKAGRTHALNASQDGKAFVSLCGERVSPNGGHDDYGDPLPPNVLPVGDSSARTVTCRRCLAKLRRASK